MKALFGDYGIELTDDGLDELVLSQEEITEGNGPMDCARAAVAKVLGLQMRTIANWKKDRPPVLAPLAFSHRMGRTGLLRYVLSLFAIPEEGIDHVLRRDVARRKNSMREP